MKLFLKLLIGIISVIHTADAHTVSIYYVNMCGHNATYIDTGSPASQLVMSRTVGISSSELSNDHDTAFNFITESTNQHGHMEARAGQIIIPPAAEDKHYAVLILPRRTRIINHMAYQKLWEEAAAEIKAIIEGALLGDEAHIEELKERLLELGLPASSIHGDNEEDIHPDAGHRALYLQRVKIAGIIG